MKHPGTVKDQNKALGSSEQAAKWAMSLAQSLWKWMGKRERKTCMSEQSAFHNEGHELKGVFPRKIMNLDKLPG